VAEIRLDADSRTVFVRTEAGWMAWNVSTGQQLGGAIAPPSAEPEFDAEGEWTPDRKFHRVSVGDGDQQQSTILDSSGRATMTVKGSLFFCEDSRHAWSLSPAQEQSVVLWDLASGKRLWTATDVFNTNVDNSSELFDVLVMEFPDGRVRLSEGGEKMVRLVRGFDVRPFDKAAARQFLEP
jgi:hypothetical protein